MQWRCKIEEMNIKKIKENNSEQFLSDIKSVREVMVYMPKSNCYFKLLKREVLKEAETGKIEYRMTDEIFVVRRMVMVVR